jgi:hypothetical protein
MIQNDHRDRAMMTSLSFNNFRVTRYRNRTRSTTAGTTHIHLNIRWEMVLFLYMCAFIVSMHQDKSKCCRRINSCVAFFPIKSGLHFSVFRSGFPLFLELYSTTGKSLPKRKKEKWMTRLYPGSISAAVASWTVF